MIRSAPPSADISKLSHAGVLLRPSHAKFPRRGTSRTAVTTASVRLRPSSMAAVYAFAWSSPSPVSTYLPGLLKFLRESAAHPTDQSDANRAAVRSSRLD